MSAAAIATALNGRQSRDGWWSVTCVVCGGQDKLGLKSGKGGLVAHCFKGCAKSQVIAGLKRLGLCGIANPDQPPKTTPEEIQKQREADEASRAQRIANAQWIWQEETVDAVGTAVDVYLASRLILPDKMPETIRFRHGHARRGRPPAMVCRIDHVLHGSIGVHLTCLTYDGRKANVDPVRQCIGACGGGCVHFGEPRPDQWLVVGEGVETTLSMALAVGAPGWAALSATGIKNLILPPDARMVLIAADNDANGTGQRAAKAAEARWLTEGRCVKVCIPPTPGTDWNDVLLAGRLDGRRSHGA